MSYRRIPPNTESMVSLKVDNLTYRTTPEMLKRVFEKYGDVGDVYIPRDPHTQDSRGFAFVRYFDERDADDAIDRLNGSLLDGRELRVQLAKHARPPQSASYSRRYAAPPRRSRRRYHSVVILCKFNWLCLTAGSVCEKPTRPAVIQCWLGTALARLNSAIVKVKHSVV